MKVLIPFWYSARATSGLCAGNEFAGLGLQQLLSVYTHVHDSRVVSPVLTNVFLVMIDA